MQTDVMVVGILLYAILGKLAAGYFSDKWQRRKPFVVAGYGLSVLSRPLLLISGSVIGVASSRFLDKVGKSIRTAPRDALIADLSDESNRGRNFGFHRALDTIGAVLGLAVVCMFLFLRSASMTDKTALWWILAAAGVVGVLTLPLLLAFIQEPPKKTDLKKSPKLSFKTLDGRLKKYLIISLFFALANSSDAFLIVRAKELGFSLLQIFLILTAFNVVAVPSYAGLADLSDHMDRKILLALGWLIYAATYFVMGWKNLSPVLFVLAMLVYGLYYGLTDGVEKAMVADFQGENKGQAFGWLALVQGFGVIPANLLFALIYEKMGSASAFAFSGSMAVIGVLGLAFFNTKRNLTGAH